MAKEGSSFNALELLARLRGEKLSSQDNSVNNNINNSPLLSNISNNSPIKSSISESDYNLSKAQALRSYSQSNQSNQSNNLSKIPNINNSSVTSISFLTPSERRENIEVRGELDKEIKRLQNEVLNLKKDKKQLQKENQSLKDELQSTKTKYDNKIAKLRDKIAKMSSHIENINMVNERRSQVFASMGIFGMAAQANVPNNNKKTSKSTPNKSSPKQNFNNVKPNSANENSTVKLPNGYVQSLPHSFAEPTFSELMRRSTAESKDFVNSLRYTPTAQPPIISGPLDTPKQNFNGDDNDDSSDLLNGFDHYQHDLDNDDEDDDDFPVMEIDLR